MSGGLESRCIGRVYGADGARHHPHRTHDLRNIETCSETVGNSTVLKQNCCIG